MMEPMAEAAAVPEPEMEPKSIFATVFVWARDPGTPPVSSLARLIRRIAIPPLFIRLPARMKNGIASREKTEIPPKIRCAPVRTAEVVFRIGRIAAIDDMPSATAIGTPAMSMMASEIRIIRPDDTAILIFLPPYYSLASL